MQGPPSPAESKLIWQPSVIQIWDPLQQYGAAKTNPSPEILQTVSRECFTRMEMGTPQTLAPPIPGGPIPSWQGHTCRSSLLPQRGCSVQCSISPFQFWTLLLLSALSPASSPARDQLFSRISQISVHYLNLWRRCVPRFTCWSLPLPST